MIKHSIVLLALTLLYWNSGYGETLDLHTAWEHAMKYDARLRVARADQAFQQEEIAKARAAFRPNVQVQSSLGRNRTKSSSLPETTDYNTQSNSISLKQTIFNRINAASYKQAKAIAAKSNALFDNEKNELYVRTFEAYSNALLSESAVALSRSRCEASAAMLEQADHAFHNGLGTVTAVDEAQANYDIAIAEEHKALNSHDFNRRELERLTGVFPDTLQHLAPESLTLEGPVPADIDVWIAQAKENNPRLAAAGYDVEIAQRELQKNRAASYPALDLVAGKSYSLSETNYTIGRTYDTYSVALQVKVPMYTGGYISASVRQASNGRTKAEEEYRFYQQQIISGIRQYYHESLNAISRIRAYEKAVASRETSLKSKVKGVQSGLATRIDVLDARQKLLAARMELSKVRYQYLLNLLMLKNTAGTLSSDDLERINLYYSKSVKK